MLVLNFTHPLTDEQTATIKILVQQDIEVISVPTQIQKLALAPLEEQVQHLIDSIALTPTEWQTRQMIINPVALSSAWGAVLAELHGRMGYFPKQIIMERGDTGFVVAGIVDLQALRETARLRR